RWLLHEQLQTSIPKPFMVVLIFWLAVIFGSFGLFAPGNGTVSMALFVCALSIAGAMFLILEMDEPFGGAIRISSAPVRDALALTRGGGRWSGVATGAGPGRGPPVVCCVAGSGECSSGAMWLGVFASIGSARAARRRRSRCRAPA